MEGIDANHNLLPLDWSNLLLNNDDDDDDNDNEDATKNNQEQFENQDDDGTSDKAAYLGRKPKWWRQLSGRKGTKAQRAASKRMKDQFCISLPPKNDMSLDITALFPAFFSTTDVNAAGGGQKKSATFEQPLREEDICAVLEIGFGLGDNLLTNAMLHPNTCYMGADLHPPGIGTLLSRIEKALLGNVYWTSNAHLRGATVLCKKDLSENTTKMYHNLKVYPGDGIKLLRVLPPSCLSSIYIAFPDPWPFKTHAKWRIIQHETVLLMARTLRSGGCVHVATDSVIFYNWTRCIFKEHKTWQEMPSFDRSGWLPVVSKYERKGLDEGRNTMCQSWRYWEQK